MKRILFVLPALFLMSNCKKADIEVGLKGTLWIEDGGAQTATIEFTKKEVLQNGVSISEKGDKIFVKGGQIYLDRDGDLIYLYDYKLSGNNLFVMTELTSSFVDPSSPSSAGVKYKQQ